METLSTRMELPYHDQNAKGEHCPEQPIDKITFNEYQQMAKSTAIYPKISGLSYLALGLAGEAGEIANKVKKIIRDDNNVLSEGKRMDLLEESGDALWYLSQLILVLESDFNTVAKQNLEKLLSRKKRHALGGTGD